MSTAPPSTLKRKQNRPIFVPHEAPPDWEDVELPDSAVLRYLADAHCHPTDRKFEREDVDDVRLGTIAAMATRATDQRLVREVGIAYGKDVQPGALPGSAKGLPSRVLVCLGYHPWFCHLLTLRPASSSPTRRDHYASIFLPESDSPSYGEQSDLLDKVLPELPDPVPFGGLLDEMRRNIMEAEQAGRMVMVGEVGLDRSFRVPFPARFQRKGKAREVEGTAGEAVKDGTLQGREELKVDGKTLMPFRPSIEHQCRILEKQFEVAVEMGVNVSLHSVRAQGPTTDFLRAFTKKHGGRFLDRVNVDMHSCGGFSVEGWLDLERHYPNIYMSPSLAISSRTPVTPALIRAASPDRILVESDTDTIGDTTRRVWACALWIAKCRGWEVELSEEEVERGGGVVSRLNENWRRFMRVTLSPIVVTDTPGV